MEFKDRLREKRIAAELTQVQLAQKAQITTRTLQNYELGLRQPKSVIVVKKIADALGTTVEELLGTDGMLVTEAYEKGGAKSAKDINELVSDVTGVFAGGELSDDALDGVMRAITDAYWIAREKNRQKYTTKVVRKKNNTQEKDESDEEQS